MKVKLNSDATLSKSEIKFHKRNNSEFRSLRKGKELISQVTGLLVLAPCLTEWECGEGEWTRNPVFWFISLWTGGLAVPSLSVVLAELILPVESHQH